jgi:hypothetical protein
MPDDRTLHNHHCENLKSYSSCRHYLRNILILWNPHINHHHQIILLWTNLQLQFTNPKIYFSKINCNINLQPMSQSSTWFLSTGAQQKYYVASRFFIYAIRVCVIQFKFLDLITVTMLDKMGKTLWISLLHGFNELLSCTADYFCDNFFDHISLTLPEYLS